MDLDLCIRGGQAVLPTGISEVDIGIRGEKIVLLGNGALFPEAKKTIDAKGKYVIPGGIDTHCHHEVIFQGAESGDDFYSGTVAAAFGGTTCIIDFARSMKGDSPVAVLSETLGRAAQKAVVDFTFHLTLTEAPPKVLSEIPKIVEMGCPSFKLFMIYKKEGRMLDDGALLAIFKAAREWGAICAVHAENAAITEYNIAQAVSEGKLEWIYHGLTKPNIVEAEAIQRAILLARHAGNALCIMHMSTREGVDLVHRAQIEGLPVYAETAPHYLTLTDEIYERADGLYFLCSPPFRKKEDIDKLWEGFKRGSPSHTGTDHSSFTPKDKEKNLQSKEGRVVPDFSKVPNGIPGIEVRLPILLDGVNKGRLTLLDLVKVFSTNAARIFGMYPRKGIIDIGSDADLVIVDLKKEKILSAKSLHMRIDFCPYEGMKVIGSPVMTILRGKVIVEEDVFLGKKGTGSFVRRKVDPIVLKDAGWL